MKYEGSQPQLNESQSWTELSGRPSNSSRVGKPTSQSFVSSRFTGTSHER